MNRERLHTYEGLANRYQLLSDSKRKQLKLISAARLVSFVGIFSVFYYLYAINILLAAIASLLLLATFLILIKKYIQTERQLLFYQQLVKINQDEIKALNRDLRPFDAGSEFTDAHHDYSYDLDLFGIGSMFQFLNRTVTSRGKRKLAATLSQSQRTVTEIIERQNAIQELSEDLDWRQNFMAQGSETENTKNTDLSEESIRRKVSLPSVKTLQILVRILPASTFVLICLSIAGFDPYSFYKWAILAQWIIGGINMKSILKFHEQFENQGKLLSRYAAMMNMIEARDFKSVHLVTLKKQLSSQGKPASAIITEFQKILDEFDYSKNLFVGFILDSIFLWDIRCLVKLYQWQQNHADNLPRWFEVLAEMDALVSLANVNYNHPNWVTPEVNGDRFHFRAEQVGHPLIDETRCVRNSFQINGEEQIVIITGANMAGKSTFLRTIGINLLLASNGCKVFAEKFEFSPVRIYTNMRTSDNLMNDESYFYAELLRLQSMLNLIRSGENLFVILDEMLKGTNSVDKLNGSKELLGQLVSLQTHGIVATHDLGLTELAEKLPSIKNQCFEVLLNNDELNFDYRLTDGITRTMNATFLMKKMGIIPKN